MDIKDFAVARRKRRSWSDEEKRSICLQNIAPGVSLSQVARRYALNASQIFNWLKDERFAPSPDETDTAVFLPIKVCSEPEPLSSVLNHYRLASVDISEWQSQGHCLHID